MFERFESKFSTYADAMETIKPKDIFTNINTKLSVVARKIEAENEQKLKEKKALNVIVFNIP